MSIEDSCKLFVAGLPETISEDILKQLFEATGGAVLSVSLPKDRTTGRPRGFGFVTMASANEADTARDSLHGSTQAGATISVRPFQSAGPPKREATSAGASHRAPMQGNSSETTLYVGNLPYDISQEEVESLITGAGAGPIVRIHLPAEPDGRKRGFGFVVVASLESANVAVEALKGAELRGRPLHINVALPKGERPVFEPRAGGQGPRSSPHHHENRAHTRDFGSPAPRGGAGFQEPRGRNFGESEGRRKRFEKERERRRNRDDYYEDDDE